ncbi:hypothetical protein JTE90_018083 [Oedothorax gibbosus]|uniref:Uncharacterized protein n=1 Tax=Oedothorax gibbosus TaxID=931172 RepID=A0AAV6UCJ3_9ARAC|nr:hypothetical protein JTE90_018083 [Oedothorax gibbosus]
MDAHPKRIGRSQDRNSKFSSYYIYHAPAIKHQRCELVSRAQIYGVMTPKRANATAPKSIIPPWMPDRAPPTRKDL